MSDKKTRPGNLRVVPSKVFSAEDMRTDAKCLVGVARSLFDFYEKTVACQPLAARAALPALADTLQHVLRMEEILTPEKVEGHPEIPLFLRVLMFYRDTMRETKRKDVSSDEDLAYCHNIALVINDALAKVTKTT